MRRPNDQKLVIVITGTTGGLGSHLLERCLADPHVERVYALNRPSANGSLLAKQRDAFVLR
jgi:nucleoside-diphosphate-sugar epimerase